ncbi:MAG: RNA methyltransferase [Bacteroidetes bacterium]|nr:RNA methyltransferase [Bacteroidota bacterium]MBS1757759.1 RNA methyltransferase [Bacteroidota bacterium]
MLSKSSIKYIQSLQHKKFRDIHHVFIAEGPKIVDEIIATGAFACKALYGLEKWVNSNTHLTQNLIHTEVQAITDFELEKISALTTPNQVLAVFEKRKNNVDIKVLNTITIVLDDIQDPGNLGTIIRIADWFGVKNIVCSMHTADMYNTKVVQSTMASLGRVNIIYTKIDEWLLQHAAIKKYVAVLDGAPVSDFKNTKEGIIIIGNESKGISQAILNYADEKITIPRVGNAESLNAAVALGIILYGLIQA